MGLQWICIGTPKFFLLHALCDDRCHCCSVYLLAWSPLCRLCCECGEAVCSVVSVERLFIDCVVSVGRLFVDCVVSVERLIVVMSVERL